MNMDERRKQIRERQEQAKNSHGLLSGLVTKMFRTKNVARQEKPKSQAWKTVMLIILIVYVASLQSQINGLERQIHSMVSAHNSLISTVNSNADEYNSLVYTFNANVDKYNSRPRR